MPNRTSIRTIAEHMNVAASTVSRALAADPGVSEEKRQEILNVARQLNYRPKPMRRKRTRNIGVIIRSSRSGFRSHEFMQGVIYQFERSASERGEHLHVSFLDDELDADPVPALVKEGRLDGVILAGYPSRTSCDAIADYGIPVVVLHDSYERTGLPCVKLDSSSGYREAFMQLLDTGRKRVAFAVSGHNPEMRDVMTQALIDAGGAVEPGLILTDLPDSFMGGKQATHHFLDIKNRPEALVFSNDWMALGCMFTLNKLGIEVPKEISVLGHDNIKIGWELDTPLTTIDSSLNGSSKAALEMLTRAMNKQSVQKEREVRAQLFLRSTWIPI